MRRISCDAQESLQHKLLLLALLAVADVSMDMGGINPVGDQTRQPVMGVAQNLWFLRSCIAHARSANNPSAWNAAWDAMDKFVESALSCKSDCEFDFGANFENAFIDLRHAWYDRGKWPDALASVEERLMVHVDLVKNQQHGHVMDQVNEQRNPACRAVFKRSYAQNMRYQDIAPSLVSYSHRSISRSFRSGTSIDKAIDEIRLGSLNLQDFPPLHVVELSGKIFAVRGNRRLFMHRVLASLGVVRSVRVQFFAPSAPEMQQLRFDDRLGRPATKLERSMSTGNGGLRVQVQSKYANRQSGIPEPDERVSFPERGRARDRSAHRRASASPPFSGSSLTGCLNCARAASQEMSTMERPGTSSSAGITPEMPPEVSAFWPGYIDPATSRRWRCNPCNADEFFFEDDPAWQRYRFRDDSDTDCFWWWHAASEQVVYEKRRV